VEATARGQQLTVSAGRGGTHTLQVLLH
jgi:hypothetical protein